MKKNAVCLVGSIVLGGFFMLSGIGKMMNTLEFTKNMLSYGLGFLAYTAPLICVGEILLGLLLILQVNNRRYALFSIASLSLFTLAFLYGFTFSHIENCGCFGEISLLDSGPLVSFTRNGVLLAISGFLYRFTEESQVQVVPVWKKTFLIVVSSLSLVLSGYTMNEPLLNSSAFLDKAVSETPLNKFIHPSNDSTYLVFVFSYGCTHCWDATENVKRYLSSGSVDRVIGITWKNVKMKQAYLDRFTPAFSITELPVDEKMIIAKALPTAYFIQKGIIREVMSPVVFSPYTFNSYYPGLMKPFK
jgi:uncharacterized membrane protein YphA (DoxX/SURF4 family)